MNCWAIFATSLRDSPHMPVVDGNCTTLPGRTGSPRSALAAVSEN
jgi:hypothetical protein